jgi:hypothetical protein
MHASMVVTQGTLRRENRAWRGTGGTSEGNPRGEFLPAFRDTASGKTYLARYADGTPAPMHLLDGLPEELVIRRDATGRTVAVKGSLVAGFLRGGRFYTREQAAECRALRVRYPLVTDR